MNWEEVLEYEIYMELIKIFMNHDGMTLSEAKEQADCIKSTWSTKKKKKKV